MTFGQANKDPEWNAFDILYFTVGFIEGLLGAFPETSLVKDCRNSIRTMRENTEASFILYNEAGDEDDLKVDANVKLLETFTFIDEMYSQCYLGIKGSSSDSSNTNPFNLYKITEASLENELIVNILFNLGYYYLDIFILVTYSKESGELVNFPLTAG